MQEKKHIPITNGSGNVNSQKKEEFSFEETFSIERKNIIRPDSGNLEKPSNTKIPHHPLLTEKISVPRYIFDTPPIEETHTKTENSVQTNNASKTLHINKYIAPTTPPLTKTVNLLPSPIEKQLSSEVIHNTLKKAREEIQVRKRKKLELIEKTLSEKETLTNREVQKILGVSDATAFRYLNQLEKEGVIEQVGKTGKAVFYRKHIK